ncbi:MAG: TRAP-type C4-dicarboxylate transport system permease small subunit [Psychromonas sp.]|jgi:TRAP-type C4-dicarboxylate transport system permease small subunit|uniref:TRAP transporter small permease n=1 Tax=Psychromonas sp. TaxID=1884585 RepID=UPI0039E68BFA
MYVRLKSLRANLDNTILTLCGAALVLLVITVTWQVFSRYVLNDPSSWTDELSRYTMVWLGLLGASYLFGIKAHLAITLLAHSIPPKINHVLQIFINMVILTFVILAMFRGGLTLAGRAMTQLTPALQIPMGYVYYILPISAVIITIYIILNVLDSFFEE